MAVKPSSPLYGAVFPDEINVGLDDMDTSSLTGAILTHLMTTTAMYSKTITVLGTIPPETSERSEPPERSRSDTEAPTAIPVRQLLMTMTFRTAKNKSLQELQMRLLGRRLSIPNRHSLHVQIPLRSVKPYAMLRSQKSEARNTKLWWPILQ